MLIITAPAKTQDFQTPWRANQISQAEFITESEIIVQKLRGFSVKKLAQLYHSSNKIAKENFKRIQVWNPMHNTENSKPAILAYAGDIFKQMTPKTYTSEEQVYAQDNLRIISGLYGIVKAYDLIQPYRLEIKAKLRINNKKSLNEFWKPKLTKLLTDQIIKRGDKHFINLASAESFNAIDLKALPVRIITVEFREKRAAGLVNVSLYSKMARGMMIEFMIKNLVREPEGLEGFNTNGYKFLKWEGDSIFFER